MSEPYRLKWDEEARDMAGKALAKRQGFSELLQGIQSKDDKKRYTSFRALLYVIEDQPALLYDEWNRFVELLDSPNAYHRYIATYLIAGLTKADAENRFEKVFDKYFALLDDGSVMVAAHAAGNAARIVGVKPALEPRITNRLLSVEKTHHDPSRKQLIKGYVIESFSKYYEQAREKRKIFEFVQKQLKSKSPRTRKMAKQFLQKWVK
jgi:hypothetical protein